MDEIELSKNLLTGIFQKNNELRDIDDSIFMMILKAGIEKAANGNNYIFNELFDHSVQLYTEEWIKNTLEEEENPDIEFEKEEAKRTFLNYFNYNS